MLAVVIASRQPQQEIFEHVQAGARQIGGAAGTDTLDELQWRPEINSHCAMTNSPTSTAYEYRQRSLDFRFLFVYSLGFPADMLAMSKGGRVQPLTRRQREILDFLTEFIEQHGYAPSLEEIGRRFGLSSLATVHKHLTNLEDKGFIRRAWNRSRSVELVPTRVGGRAIELPLLGTVAAGAPIEAVASSETIAVPEDLVAATDTYALRVRGSSMIDEQIRDGDIVIVEDRKTANNGEMVIALLRDADVTLKKFYHERGRIRLQPANPAVKPLVVEPDQVQIQGVVVGVMRRY